MHRRFGLLRCGRACVSGIRCIRFLCFFFCFSTSFRSTGKTLRLKLRSREETGRSRRAAKGVANWITYCYCLGYSFQMLFAHTCTHWYSHSRTCIRGIHAYSTHATNGHVRKTTRKGIGNIRVYILVIFFSLISSHFGFWSWFWCIWMPLPGPFNIIHVSAHILYSLQMYLKSILMHTTTHSYIHKRVHCIALLLSLMDE